MHTIELYDSENYCISGKCPYCGKGWELIVSIVNYAFWCSGMLIQNAFRSMSKEDREKLVTGTCGDCWDSLFHDDAS